MHTLLAATKDPLAMDPPVANQPKKSKTKKSSSKAITKTIPAAPTVSSTNVITTIKPKVTLQALNLPAIPQINQAEATTEAANTQASSVTAQPMKANKTKSVMAKADQVFQSLTGNESVTAQIKTPLQALNLPDILKAIQAPITIESANSQALIAPTKPKKASKAKKAADKAITSATDISLALTTTHTAITQGRITNEAATTHATAACIRTNKASKTKKATVKGIHTDTEFLEAPNATETATRQIEATAAAIWPKKFKGKKTAIKGPNSAYEVPPAIQMVTNQALAATFQVRRGSRAHKSATKAQIAESQTKIVDQGAQAKMATFRTNKNALETQVAAAVQALADDYLAHLSLEPTTRTRGKKKQKVRSLTLPPLIFHFFPIPILLVCSFVL